MQSSIASLTGGVGVAVLLSAEAFCAGSPGLGRVVPSKDAWTPVIATQLAPNDPAILPGTDGRFHVDYELLLVNTRRMPATIASIAALDAADELRVVGSWSGQSLLGALREPSNTHAAGKDGMMPAKSARRVFIDLAFDRRKAVPRRIVHRLDVSGEANPGVAKASSLSYVVAPVTVSSEQLSVFVPRCRARTGSSPMGAADLAAHIG